jgi:tRNA A-37 threonylcarbamoyl transferase component Bud32
MGKPLSVIVNTTVDTTVRQVLGVARGLAYLHKWGLVHGDIRGVSLSYDSNKQSL